MGIIRIVLSALKSGRKAFAAAILGACLLGVASPAAADNPFGLVPQPLNGEGLDMTLARSRGLGIAWIRPPDIFLNHFNPDSACPSCRAYAASGLSIALVIKAQGQDWPSRKPSAPPVDLDAFRGQLEKVIQAWKPTVLIIEGSENDGVSMIANDPGHAAYLREIDAACAVAHAHKLFCTNGGLSSRSIAAALWLDFLARNQPDQACDFAKRVFYTESDPDAGASFCAYKTPDQVPTALKSRLLADADQLLTLYRATALDAVNFHWFIHDARALSQTVEFIRTKTGKPAVSTEIGQWRWDAAPAHVRPLLRAAFAAQMQLALWYSVESDNTASLFDAKGLLRPAGWEFQRQTRGK